MTTTVKPRGARHPRTAEAGQPALPPRERLVGAYRTMVTARTIDARILVLLKQGKVFFHIGGSGHEAAQTAVATALEPGSDWAYPYYRDLAFSLQLGYTVDEIMLEALHRVGGPSSNGFAMPFHYGHARWRIIAQSNPTSGILPELLSTTF